MQNDEHRTVSFVRNQHCIVTRASCSVAWLYVTRFKLLCKLRLQGSCPKPPPAGPINAASESTLQSGQCLITVNAPLLHFLAEPRAVSEYRSIWLHNLYIWTPEQSSGPQVAWHLYDMMRVLWLTHMTFHGGETAVHATANVFASGVRLHGTFAASDLQAFLSRNTCVLASTCTQAVKFRHASAHACLACLSAQ